MSGAVRVMQCDRDAAADFAGNYVPFTKEGMAALRSGTHDDHLFVQVFARHREAETERCAKVALEQRCERGTPWDLACTSIAQSIRSTLGDVL